jgi:RNA ligase (TIGR02306 family)
MSTLQATVERIAALSPHPNADRLELATVLGWQCVVQKDRYKVGDLVLYIPIDSVLPEDLECLIFGPESKVKLHNHRVKTIKLRGAISQGLVVSLKSIDDYADLTDSEEGADLTAELGITKYEPPIPGFQSFNRASKKKQYENPNFKKYTSLENIKKYNKVFEADDDVVITEKIHGTNFRAGWVPYDANTLFKKLKKLLGLAPRWEFVFGSHNVQLDASLLDNPKDNVYANAVVENHLMLKLMHGEIVYGEIYGPKIQKGYAYGLKDDKKGLVIFDIQHAGSYLSHEEFAERASALGLKTAPVLYVGKFGGVDMAKIVDGDSVLDPSQKCREGVVVKSLKEATCYMGRKALKAINPEYLLGDQTDFH